MKSNLKKGLLAAFCVVALNIVVFFIAFGLRGKHAASAASSFSALPLLLLIGGFVVILGLAVVFFLFTRRLSRSLLTEPAPSALKSAEAKPADAAEARADGLGPEAILDSMFEGFIALDPELRIILVNQRFCSMFGVEKERAGKGMSLLEFSRSAELEEAAQQVLSSGLPVELTIRRYSSGMEQRFEVSAVPLKSGFPEARRGVVMALGDVSRLAKLEQVRKDFAANVSHELRTPIQVVKGFTENLLESDLNDKEEIRSFVKIIEKNVRVMENLTNDLLTLVSLEAEGTLAADGNARPSREENLLAPLVCEAADMAGYAAKKKDITVETNCPPDLSAKVYASLIIQALVNLLDNAIKYSSAGSLVKVTAFREGGQIVIEVKDRGIGIPAEHLGRIFERFYRVDRSRQRTGAGGGTGAGVQAGIGLGLSIVRHIALLHNGSVEAESHAGEGSVFTLRLPVESDSTCSP